MVQFLNQKRLLLIYDWLRSLKRKSDSHHKVIKTLKLFHFRYKMVTFKKLSCMLVKLSQLQKDPFLESKKILFSFSVTTWFEIIVSWTILSRAHSWNPFTHPLLLIRNLKFWIIVKLKICSAEEWKCIKTHHRRGAGAFLVMKISLTLKLYVLFKI